MSEQAQKADLAFFSGPTIRHKVEPEKTAIIVICMQNIFLRANSPIYSPNAETLVPKLQGLLELCRGKKMKVIHVMSALRADGSDLGRLGDIRPMIRQKNLFGSGTPPVDVIDELKSPGDIFIEKRRYDAFFGTDLDVVLRANNINTVLISGIATNGCCEATACEAFSRDYKVVFLSDGNATEGLPDMGWGPLSPEVAQRSRSSRLRSAVWQRLIRYLRRSGAHSTAHPVLNGP